MLSHIQKTIDSLNQKVKQNVAVIYENQEEMKRLKSRSIDYKSQFDAYVRLNKELLIQNNEMINVQLTLINFIEKYRHTAIIQENLPVIDIYSISDEEELLELTVKNIIPFNHKHPNYRNEEFIDRLIMHYENIENYEVCSELKRWKEEQSQ